MDPLETLRSWVDAVRAGERADAVDAAHDYTGWVAGGGWAVRIQRTTRGPAYTVRRLDGAYATVSPIERPTVVVRVPWDEVAASLEF